MWASFASLQLMLCFHTMAVLLIAVKRSASSTHSSTWIHTDVCHCCKSQPPSFQPSSQTQLSLLQAVLAITLLCLPREFHGIFTDEPERIVKNYYLFFCVASGLWGGLTIGLVTEYYTSNAYAPVKVGRGGGVLCDVAAPNIVVVGLQPGWCGPSGLFSKLALAMPRHLSMWAYWLSAGPAVSPRRVRAPPF